MFKTRVIRSVNGFARVGAGLVACLLMLGMLATSPVEAGKPLPTPLPAQGSFVDPLDTYDTSRWAKADGWVNGAPFDNAWRADHITFANSQMSITIDNTAYLGKPYSSGEYRTLGFYGYGCFEASFQPIARPGVVTSLYTFAGPYDNGGNGQHNEIDIEFLGYDTTKFQANFWTNDDAYARGHEHMVNLGFDASQALHNYGFKWTSTGITWYVDGAAVYTVVDSAADPTPKVTETLHKIMMNQWPVDSSASTWAGTFVYPGTQLTTKYDWVRYTVGEGCTIGGTLPPSPTPTPGGSSTGMHVQSIVMALASRNTQATARVTILDGTGKLVSGATVKGKWSGLVYNGDGSKTTATDGTALFYSGRSSSSGTFTFCVTSVTKAGMTYDASTNGETCDSVRK